MAAAGVEPIIRGVYEFSFSLFGINIDSSDLATTIKNLLDFNVLSADASSPVKFSLWHYVTGINEALVAVGISLATLFFFISIIKMAQDGVERVSWERIVFKAVMFFVVVFFIQNSLQWFVTIAKVVQNSVYQPILNAMSLSEYSTGIADELVAIVGTQSTILQYVYTFIFVLLAIPYMATIIMILSQVFLRAVKIIIYLMVSPIPLALATEGEVYRGKAITFFMSFAGVCFEAVVIYIGLFIYCQGLSGLAGGINGSGTDGIFGLIIAIMFMNGLFAAIISLSSQLSREFFGRG